MPNVIDKFTGSNRFLSNFYPSPIINDGVAYPTVEHAYQAHKTLDELDRGRIAALPDPGSAKGAGRHVRLRGDWEDVKLGVMLTLLRLKFAAPELRAKLLATGDAELVEGNYWGDTFWGVCRGRGENHLGKLLMQVREELR